MKAIKYEKVDVIPDSAVKISTYANSIGQNNPAYICIAYDRYKFGYKSKNGSMLFGSDPGYKIVNWQGYNFVIPHK